MKNKLYVVTMQRWGDNETHHYLLGVFTKKAKAQKEGREEETYRGGKYNALIQEITPNLIMRVGEFKEIPVR